MLSLKNLKHLGVCWIFLWIPVADGKYFVSQNQSLWGDHKECLFAGNILFDFSTAQITAKIPDILVDSKEKFWVGYLRRYTIFQYTGCMSVHDLKELVTPIKMTDSSPGKCLSACANNLHIGITTNQCFCLGEDFTVSTYDLQIHCTSKCESPVVACGGNFENTTYLSVYRTSLNYSSSNGGNCLSFDPSQRTYLWKKCSLSLLGMCAKDNKVYAIPQSSFLTWLETVNHCFQNRSLPTNYSNSNLLQVTAGSEFWTGLYQSKAIFKEDIYLHYHDQIEFGYLQKIAEDTNDIYELHFERTNNKMRRYLCSQEDTTVIEDRTTVSSSVETSHTETTFLSTKSITLSPSRYSSTGYSTKTDLTNIISTTTTTTRQGLVRNEESNTGAFIGISVAAVFLLCAIALVIVIYKRRDLVRKICNRETSENKSSKSITSIAAASNNCYEEVKDSKSNQGNDSLSGSKNDITLVSTECNGHYAHIYLVLEDNANQRTVDVDSLRNSLAKADDSDVYNTLNSDNKHEYNRDCTYDTSETALRKANMVNYRDEDTYNHINSKSMSTTDNVYGVPSGYRDVTDISENEIDANNTYSKLNTTQFHH